MSLICDTFDGKFDVAGLVPGELEKTGTSSDGVWGPAVRSWNSQLEIRNNSGALQHIFVKSEGKKHTT